MGDLTQEQVEEYLSKSPINESNEPIQPIEVDWEETIQLLKAHGIKPIVMSNVEEYLRSQGAIDTQELLEVINKC